jgi:hypothetical protein
MVAELENGQVVTLRFVPRPIPGVTHTVNGARIKTAAPPRINTTPIQPQEHSPRTEDVELLKFLVSNGEPPGGFEPIALPGPTRFDKFSVVPLTGWFNGANKRIMVFSLVAVPGQTAVVAPNQFYRPGITAVMLDGDVVDEQHSPQLFVVEELNDE